VGEPRSFCNTKRRGDANYFELLLPELIAYFNKLMEAYQAYEEEKE